MGAIIAWLFEQPRVRRIIADCMANIARACRAPAVEAALAMAEGAIALADGDGAAALALLRRACRLWQDVDAPYDIARTRALLAEACLAQNDGDAAALELRAARSTFERLGAVTDMRRVEQRYEQAT